MKSNSNPLTPLYLDTLILDSYGFSETFVVSVPTEKALETQQYLEDAAISQNMRINITIVNKRGTVNLHFFSHTPRICKACGKEYTNTHRNKIYCKKNCGRKSDPNKARTEKRKEALSEPKTCARPYCRNRFIAKRRDQKYCSKDCSRIHWKARTNPTYGNPQFNLEIE